MPTKKSEEKPLEQRSDKQQKIDDNILSDSLRGSKKEVSKDSNKFVPLNKSDKKSKQILNKSNKSMKVIIKTASNHVK